MYGFTHIDLSVAYVHVVHILYFFLVRLMYALTHNDFEKFCFLLPKTVMLVYD